ncbi:MAG: hypothetical protein IPL61_08040 [Myxococcales bacterium]|nr:hypothetical protein [Myxococcales bacterium]
MRRELSERTCAFLWVTAPPREIEPLIAALLQAFRDFGEKPRRMWPLTRTKKNSYSEARFVAAVRADETTSVTVKGLGLAQVSVHLDLRTDRRYPDFSPKRYVELTAPVVTPDDPRLLEFLRTACALYPVSQGGVFRAENPDHAGAEASLCNTSTFDPEASRRIDFDAGNRDDASLKVRRLYPVTIIGPEIWAALPPLPEVAPPLVVRDLADCKMVTAWPTLVDPHDLQFLLGTRALRRWLWPHTIQNPADDPHEVDIRLKWAELLPW